MTSLYKYECIHICREYSYLNNVIYNWKMIYEHLVGRPTRSFKNPFLSHFILWFMFVRSLIYTIFSTEVFESTMMLKLYNYIFVYFENWLKIISSCVTFFSVDLKLFCCSDSPISGVCKNYIFICGLNEHFIYTCSLLETYIFA